MQSKESSDANSELCKEDDDEAMYKNPYEIRLCDLISVSLARLRAGAGKSDPPSALSALLSYRCVHEGMR